MCVGQTKRKLKTHIKEHQNDINKTIGNLSIISEHQLEENYDFKWEALENLDKEPFYYKRLSRNDTYKKADWFK